MLNQVVLGTVGVMTIDIDQVDPDEILLIKSISGLSAADLTLFTGEFARDGGYYQGRRAVKRNPVITFKMNPDYKNDVSISDIREQLYRMFLEPTPDSDGVKVLLKDDRRPDRYFIGYTETINTDMWAQEQTAQVSMLCVDPYLKSNDLTTDTDAVGWTSLPLEYDGSAATGLDLWLKVINATTEINIDLNGVKMTLEGSFAPADIIQVNTVTGSRAIRQNGSDVMASLTGGSRWLQLNQQFNTLKVYGSVEGDGDVVLNTYTYRSSWWGI